MGSSDGSEPGGQREGQAGTVVDGRFVLLREIGVGAMGTVYEAEDQRFRRRVAIKLLGRQLVRPQDAGRRFKREAQAAAGIQHPNVVVIHDFGQRRDGTCYLVQELLSGVDLRRHLIENKRLTVEEALDILVPIMGAVVAAHRKGVIHRDLKPENIFLSDTALGGVVPKLIDFGIALAPESLPLRTSSDRRGLVGSLNYVSPEQARDDKLDGRADAWAVAVVLFELLVGTPPFEAKEFSAVLARVLSPDPVPRVSTLVDGVPVELADILAKALARRLDDRYPNMEAFLLAVLGFARAHLPFIAQKHAASIPRYVESAPPPSPQGGVDLGEEGAFQPLSRWRPFVRPDLEGQRASGGAAEPSDSVTSAEEDLRISNLQGALAHATHAVDVQRVTGEQLGRMRLVQASAGRWLGHFADTEHWAREALNNLPRGSRRWYSAFGHLALVTGYRGKNTELLSLVDELSVVERSGDPAAHVGAGSRLCVSLVRAGRMDLAQQIFGTCQAILARISLEDPSVLAWMDVANAELELYAGHITTSLQLLEAAVTGFVEGGRVRNTCLQRANIGNHYLRLGLHQRAEQTLRAAVLVGEPMRLAVIGPARVNLGLALARLGDTEQALEVERAALEQCVRDGNRCFEAVAHVYLAEIELQRDNAAVAEGEARRAVVCAATFPGVRAHALAVLADILLRQRRVDGALVASREALGILEALEGVAEGEALIRLVHVLALEADGDVALASSHARVAQRRLLDQADHIADPLWRRSFLESVPENARTRALALRS
jgi:serine/threonine protein kinase/tetratricopeptide (TPR) repeat protein